MLAAIFFFVLSGVSLLCMSALAVARANVFSTVGAQEQAAHACLYAVFIFGYIGILCLFAAAAAAARAGY